MADPKSQSNPRDQEQAVQRRPYPHDPTRGLGGGRPGGGATVTPERARTDATDEPADPALPADDATLKTKI